MEGGIGVSAFLKSERLASISQPSDGWVPQPMLTRPFAQEPEAGP